MAWKYSTALCLSLISSALAVPLEVIEIRDVGSSYNSYQDLTLRDLSLETLFNPHQARAEPELFLRWLDEDIFGLARRGREGEQVPSKSNEELEKKGKERMDANQAAHAPPSPKDKKSQEELNKQFNQGYTAHNAANQKEIKTPADAKTGMTVPQKDELQRAGVPHKDEDFKNVQVHSKSDANDPTKPAEKNALGRPKDGNAVTDRFHEKDGHALVGQSAYASNDGERVGAKQGLGNQPLKTHELAQATDNKIGATSPKEAWVAGEIANKDTQRAVNDVHGGEPGVKTHEPGTKEHNTLHGTDNMAPASGVSTDFAKSQNPVGPITSKNPPKDAEGKPLGKPSLTMQYKEKEKRALRIVNDRARTLAKREAAVRVAILRRSLQL